MELVTAQSEDRLIELLPSVQEQPADWISLHINLAPIHRQMISHEGLSRALLAKIHKISLQMAEKIRDLGLGDFNGHILVFEDSDVLALIKARPSELQKVFEALRCEFKRSGMMHLLSIESMQEKLSRLVLLSEEKQETAQDYKMKRRAVELGESLLEWTEVEPQLSVAIQKKRRQREASSVLIIEDDVMVRGVLAAMLKEKHHVIQAKNAEQGVIAYIDQAPDIVFLDVHMPRVGGHETLKRLRIIDPEIYAVMISGDSSQGTVISAKDEGAAGFIRKPFSQTKLQAYIERCPSLQPENIAAQLGWHELKNPLRASAD